MCRLHTHIHKHGIVVMTTIYPTAAAAAAISFLYLGRFILQNGAIRERTNERASDMSFSFFFLFSLSRPRPTCKCMEKKRSWCTLYYLSLPLSSIPSSALPSPSPLNSSSSRVKLSAIEKTIRAAAVRTGSRLSALRRFIFVPGVNVR